MAGEPNTDDNTEAVDDSEDAAAPPTAEPVYNDRSKLDFDPDDGLYSGTAVDGTTDIPGEHERVDDVPVEDDDSEGAS